MKKIFFYQSKYSNGCRDLCKAVGGKRIKLVNSRYKPKEDHLVINWGSSRHWLDVNTMNIRYTILNHPMVVHNAVNKLKSLYILSEANIDSRPQFTTCKDNAVSWLEDNKVVYCRTKLCGKSGEGIVVARSIDEIVDAPLYTLGFNAHHEYRVHVFNGKVIDVVKKSRKRDEEPSHDIRNVASGWVFIRNYESIIPSWVEEECIKAVTALGLDFGAVDVGYNKDLDKACIYECNSAPGMKFNSQTCKKYRDAILNYCATLP